MSDQSVDYVLPSTYIRLIAAHPQLRNQLMVPLSGPLQDNDDITYFHQSPLARQPERFSELRSFVKGSSEFCVGDTATVSNGSRIPWIATIQGAIGCFLLLTCVVC